MNSTKHTIETIRKLEIGDTIWFSKRPYALSSIVGDTVTAHYITGFTNKAHTITCLAHQFTSDCKDYCPM